MEGISKAFYSVAALSDVSFGVDKGSVHAVMGENGAGKSTLMKILGGVYHADKGRITIDGTERRINNVQDAAEAGISVIYQEFNLIPELTVAENIFIANKPKMTVCGIVQKPLRNQKAQELLDSLGIRVDPTEYVKNLSVSEKQMVEIAKALSQDSEIIIMDEPTAALNDEEVNRLQDIIRLLQKEGKTILYISHRLKEVFDVTDTVTVLRDGKYVGTKPTAELTEEEIIRMMVGHTMNKNTDYQSKATDRVILKVDGLTKKGLFEDVSFELRAGEVLGVAGLMGCGSSEALSAIYGLIQPDSGTVSVDGAPVRIKSAKDGIRHGISFLTDDRKDAGILPIMSVRDNTTIISIRDMKKKLGFYISPAEEAAQLERMTRRMNTKYASSEQKITYLSGGNQQKVLLGRNLLCDTKVFIMLEPTRGIDVGAKEEIYKLLGELAATGMGIVAVFSDLNELVSVCDRTLVFYEGKVMGELTRAEFDNEKILTYASGRIPEGAAKGVGI